MNDDSSDDSSEKSARPASGAAVETHGLCLRGDRGWVYREVDLSIEAGRLTALVGEPGSGRTALLLTLGGRMRPTGGTATVGGHRLPRELRAVQRISALGLIDGVNDLEPALTVAEHMSEAMDVHEGLLGPLRHRTRITHIRQFLEQAGLGHLDPRTEIHDLMPDEARLLGAAMALVGRPRLLLLDDVDARSTTERQRRLWQRLRAIADSGPTVLATCHDTSLVAEIQEFAEVVRLPPSRPTGDEPEELKDTEETEETEDGEGAGSR